MASREESSALRAIASLPKRIDDLEANLAILAEELRRANRIAALAIVADLPDAEAHAAARAILDWARGEH